MFDWMTPAFLLMYDPLSQAVVAITIAIVGAVFSPYTSVAWVL